MTDVLLARIDFTLRGANYQRSGGKGRKPEMLKVPGMERRQRPGQQRTPDRGELIARMKSMGYMPADT